MYGQDARVRHAQWIASRHTTSSIHRFRWRGGRPNPKRYNARALLNADRQRRIDRLFGPPLSWLVSVLLHLRGAETPPHDVRRILDIVLSAMGAIVLTPPMFA